MTHSVYLAISVVLASVFLPLTATAQVLKGGVSKDAHIPEGYEGCARCPGPLEDGGDGSDEDDGGGVLDGAVEGAIGGAVGGVIGGAIGGNGGKKRRPQNGLENCLYNEQIRHRERLKQMGTEPGMEYEEELRHRKHISECYSHVPMKDEGQNAVAPGHANGDGSPTNPIPQATVPKARTGCNDPNVPNSLSLAMRSDLQALLHDMAHPLPEPTGAPSDEFLKGVREVIGGMLEFLSQPRGNYEELGVPARQIIDRFVHHTTSFPERWEQMNTAIKEIQRNPARLVGKISPGCVLSVGVAAKIAQEVAQTAKEVHAITQAAEEFAVTEKNMSGPRVLQSDTREPVYGALPPGSDAVPGTCYQNQCYLNAKAVDHYWKTSEWVEPKPRGIDYIDELRDQPILRSALHLDLGKTYGGKRALAPGTQVNSNGQLLHAVGRPIRIAGQDVAQAQSEIAAGMRSLGPDAQGLVIVDCEIQVGNETVVAGHVFNVRTHPDLQVEFFDRSTKGPPDVGVWRQAKKVWFYRTR